MTVSIPDWISVIGVIIAISGVIGGGVFLVRGAYDKARIEALRNDWKDAIQRLDERDREIAKMRERENGFEREQKAANDKIEMLTAMVTQRADVEAVKEHNAIVTAHLEEIAGQLGTLVSLLLNRSPVDVK